MKTKFNMKCAFGHHDDDIIKEYNIPPAFKSCNLTALPHNAPDTLVADLMQSSVIIVYKCRNCKRVRESVHKNFKL